MQALRATLDPSTAFLTIHDQADDLTVDPERPEEIPETPIQDALDFLAHYPEGLPINSNHRLALRLGKGCLKKKLKGKGPVSASSISLSG